MDHLPNVVDPYQPIEIPFLGGERYDGLDFVGYPSRQNWRVDALLEGDLQGRTVAEAAQFLQTWLYFGMIRETLVFNQSDPIPWDDFVRVNLSGQSIISTRRLPNLLTALIAKLRAAKVRGEHAAYFEQFRECMELSCKVWKTLVLEISNESAPNLLSPEILFSIEILGDALDIGITEVCKSSYLNFNYSWRSTPPPSFLMNRMISQGWCPSVVHQLSSPSITFLYYASLLGPPGPIDHSHCVAEARSCSAKMVDAGNYKIKHILESCECSHVFISTGEGSKVANAIREGKIPVIYARDDGSDLVIDIEVYSEPDPVAYTAISHVWSDGLGNPEDNSMPSCQLKHLIKLVGALSAHRDADETNGTILPASTKPLGGLSECRFWMDTLCVPVSNMLLRNKAIERMRDVYIAASNVLVLDAELMKSSAERGFEEIFTRIICSTWIRRLWTLQEAILNNHLLFQFAEKALYVDASSPLSRARLREVSRNPWNLVAWECQGTTNKLGFKALQAGTGSEILRISHLWSSLANRSTSRVGDEPLCIAILHDLNIKAFQEPPYAGTVRKFWALNVKGVPSYVLFLPGPRLADGGYGWAPASLLNLKIMGTDFRMADITPRGLLVSYPGIILSKLRDPAHSIIACSINGDTYFIRQSLLNNNPSWDELGLENYTNLAVIIKPALVPNAAISRGKYSFEVALGALVDIREDGDIKFVRYLRFVTVLKKGSYRERNNNFSWTPVEIREKTKEPIQGFLLPTSQKWCVG